MVRSRTAGAVRDPAAVFKQAAAFIFDVEGTLVDSVMPTLQCWRETLEAFGVHASLADLHHYSGMDGNDMLDRILPQPIAPKLKSTITDQQGERYRAEYLPRVRALPGVRALFEELNMSGRKIALATSCRKDELDRYLELTQARDLVDAIACGDDVKHGKPHPDLISLALKRLRIRESSRVCCAGDTPYDAEAARKAGVHPVGLLTGHFPASDLLDAGCLAVFRDPEALARILSPAEADPALAQAS